MSESTAADRRGVVIPEADGRQLLEFHRSWPDPIEAVWSALTEPDRLARWMGRYDGERHAGGRGTFTMTHEPGEPVGQPTQIVECDPPRRLVVELGDQGDFRLEVDLLADDGGTELVFRQRFAPDVEVVEYAGGWHWYLDHLDAELGGGAPPAPWDEFWAEIGPGYRSANT
jgi:uncharacterized protein YndB with AHSA1/START domain